MSEPVQMSGCFLGGPLSADHLLQGLPKAALEKFSKLRRRKLLKEGTSIVSAGTTSKNICILCSGSAIFCVPSQAGRKILREMAPNELMGVTEAISGATFEYDVITTSPTFLDVIKKADFLDFMNKTPEFCFRLLTDLGSNLQKSYQTFSEQPKSNRE